MSFIYKAWKIAKFDIEYCGNKIKYKEEICQKVFTFYS